MGLYGAYACIHLENRRHSVRTLAYPPPGADAGLVLKAIVDDLISLAKEGVVVYDAVIKPDVIVRVFPCMEVIEIPMAAKYSRFFGGSGTEKCTSCDIVKPQTRTEPRDWAKSSEDTFDVRDLLFACKQERTSTIISRVKGTPNISTAAMKCAVLLNGVAVSDGDHFLRLTEGRGPGLFHVHEHVIAAPSHLIYYGMASQLLEKAYGALSVGQRDLLVRKVRACAAQVPTYTLFDHIRAREDGGNDTLNVRLRCSASCDTGSARIHTEGQHYSAAPFVLLRTLWGRLAALRQ